MGTARDIALIFLSMEALVVALIPLALLSALAYGIYRLQKSAKQYLKLGQVYAQKAHAYVEKASRAVVDPLIRVHTKTQMVTTMVERLFSRRSL
jgi:predicted ABC-type exoprotein transport system permease subunit